MRCWGSRPLVYDCSRGRPPESPLLCPSQPVTRPGPGPSCFSGGAHVGVRWMENGVEAPGSAGWGAARGRGGASPAPVSPKPASCLMQTRSLAPPARRTPRRTRFLPTSVRRYAALTLWRRPQRGPLLGWGSTASECRSPEAPPPPPQDWLHWTQSHAQLASAAHLTRRARWPGSGRQPAAPVSTARLGLRLP